VAGRAASLGDLNSPVLLYDGECGFCAGSVQFVLAHERPERRTALRFAPLQGEFGTMVRQRFPALVDINSVVWFDPSLEDERAVRVRSTAALAALAHVGGAWRVLARLGMLVPRVVRDLVYDAIAKRRFELAAPACLIPTADTRARFLA
jgi:predicted DCC family thiol-disulfide oxidoreductase YuxK